MRVSLFVAGATAVAWLALVAAAPPQGATKHRRQVGGIACSGATGPSSGVFAGQANAVPALDSGIVAGEDNRNCGNTSTIAAGAFDVIASNEQPSSTAGAQNHFIGAGVENGIGPNTIAGKATDTYDSGIVSGFSNAVSANYAFIGAGQQNAVARTPLATQDGVNAAVVAGIGNEVDGYDALIGGGESNRVTATSPDSVLAGGNQNEIDAATASFIGSGAGNVITGCPPGASTDGSGSRGLGAHGNRAYGFGAHGAGSARTTPRTIPTSPSCGYAFVGGGVGNSVLSVAGFVGAGEDNSAPGESAFIGAGGLNVSDGNDSAVVAGYENFVYTSESAVVGGEQNVITPTNGNVSEPNAALYGFIGGGSNNSIEAVASLGANYAAIGGGAFNRVSGSYASVGGGRLNSVSGEFASIPGGYGNEATGTASFAAGDVAEALTEGSFVWSDAASTSLHVKSTVANQFLARASGGFKFFSSPNMTSGVSLAPGAGSWSSLSDRAAKTNVVPLDDAAVLAKVAALPVSTWSYRTEDARVRHVGPMAQDFYAAFHVGEDDRHITTIDEDGVALSAIKALYRKNAAAQRENGRLKSQLTAVQREVAELAAEVRALRAR